MATRKAAEVVADNGTAPADTTTEFEVDPHGAASNYTEPNPESGTAETPDAGAPVVPLIMGWTPEEAGQLVCAIFNFGILIYGPEWAADPRETAGWNISAAQLLDQFLPRGTGGFIELGAGLIMVGNGLAMMTVNRLPLIRRGPRPMWAPRPAAPATETPEPPPPTPSHDGAYKMPRDLAPMPTDPLVGLGL